MDGKLILCTQRKKKFKRTGKLKIEFVEDWILEVEAHFCYQFLLFEFLFTFTNIFFLNFESSKILIFEFLYFFKFLCQNFNIFFLKKIFLSL